MPGCFLDPFQEYHRAQFENQHSRPRDPLYKKVAMYKTASCDDLSLSGCLVLLQQGSHSGDNNLDTVMQREYWPGGRSYTLAAGTFTIRAVHEGKNALQLSSSCAKSKKKHILQGAVTEKKPAGQRLSMGLLQTVWEERFSWTGSQSLLGEAEDPLA